MSTVTVVENVGAEVDDTVFCHVCVRGDENQTYCGGGQEGPACHAPPIAWDANPDDPCPCGFPLCPTCKSMDQLNNELD